jgi:hypothetical protein
MGGLKSGLVTVVIAGALGICTVVGCTADGSGAIEDTAPLDPENPNTLPPSSSSGDLPDDAGKPDAKKDGSTKDSAAPDAGPPPPVPDTPCATVDEVRKKPCGACGNQSTICLSVAGAKKWSVYSSCEQELVGGCIPGTFVNEPCGNCGTLKRTCSQFCAYINAACGGQPASSCVPGSVELQSAGCPTANLFHQRTCGATCTAPSFDATCSAPPTVVEVGPTPGNVSSTIAILSEAQSLTRISGTACPAATLTTIVTPYVYLQVHNPLAKSATVEIYNSLAPGGVVFKTALAAYDGAVAPTDDATRKVCLKAATTGTVALTGDSKFASLNATKTVTIAPGATVSVYVAAYYAYDPTKPTESTGKVKLNVSTVSLQ